MVVRWVAVLAVVVATGACSDDDGPEAESATATFDAARWRAADPGDPADQTRCELVDELDAVLAPGASRDEVEEALGAGDDRDAVTVVWPIGACGLAIDIEELWVTFDDEGVVEWRQVQG